MFQHLLVPVDGSPLSDHLVTRAVEAAKRSGARLTFFHASRDFAETSDGALAHAAWPEAFGKLAQAHALTVLAKAEAAARLGGVVCQAMTRPSHHPPEAIVAAAHSAGCDAVFIASRGGSRIGRLLRRSVTQDLLAISDLPVIVFGAIARHAPSDEEVASSILRNEHRSLAAVLHALTDVLSIARATGSAVDVRLVSAMLYYIEQFPERLHHPKEEAYLFAKLLARAPEHRELLERLSREHDEGARQLVELRQALEYLDQAPALGLQPLADLARRYVQRQIEHMELEEHTLKDAARAHLTEDDWRDIRRAFVENGDARFGALADEPFDHLLGHLMSLAYGAPSSDGSGRRDPSGLSA